MPFRCFLRVASPVVHSKLLETPDLTILDLKNYRKATIDCVLQGIYTGKAVFNNDIEKEMVTRLCQELDIDMTCEASEAETIKVNAPKVPQEEPKNKDPGLMRLKDGRIRCGICFKVFAGKFVAKQHYQNVHMSKGKNVSCRVPGCDRKFKNTQSMRVHIIKTHGISSAKTFPIPSTSAAKSTKATKKESSKKSIKKESAVKEEPIED